MTEPTTLDLTMRRLFSAGVVLLSLTVACGDDDDEAVGDHDATEGNDSSGASGSSGGSGSSGDADFYAPKTAVQLLDLEREVDWTELSGTPSSLTRFSMGPADGDDLVVVQNSETSVDAELSIASGLAGEREATQNLLLSSMFKLYERDDDLYQVIATKHHNYALDGDGTTLSLRDWRSDSRDDDAGFLLFALRPAGDRYVLVAEGRQELDSSGAYVDDDSWSTAELVVNDDAVALDAASGSGTELTFYAPPFDFDIPTDFNPKRVERQPNTEFEAEAGEDLLVRLPNQVEQVYQDQLSAPGLDGDTTEAAESMLEQIEADLEEEGASMRYPAEFYMTVREGLLRRVLVSSDNIDGVLGQHTVPYVYFTNETDEEGVHHPMMVAASYNLPDTLGLLWDVTRPPGDGLTEGYASQQVTRNFNRKGFLQRFPMRDYGTVSDPGENMMEASLAGDLNVTDFDRYNYSSVGHSAFAMDGVLIYPAYNNNLEFAQVPGELSAHGNHSGRGLGMHYHSDPNIARDTDSGVDDQMGLYNLSDYEGHSHPPIVTLSFDGVAGYGAYLEGDSDSDGVDVELDQFGGHSHDGYGYHYHSYTTDAETDDGIEFTERLLPPLGAWGGAINEIPDFWGGREPDNSDRNGFVGVAERPEPR